MKLSPSTLLHEVAHDVVGIGGDNVMRICQAAFESSASEAVTQRATTQWEEYFPESWVAYHVERNALSRLLEPMVLHTDCRTLYTVILDYRGGTYISQVNSGSAAAAFEDMGRYARPVPPSLVSALTGKLS